ncbi:MAG: response regulator transcription factor [Candidatus Marinimicrobia bacterium]|nr:response regulator transcription factor [Candidatus Neomarinimicrobiota bacterium]
MKQIHTVYIIDWRPIVRDGLKLTLEDNSNLKFIGESDRPYKAILDIDRLKPNIVLVNPFFPDYSGPDIVEMIRIFHNFCKIVVIESEVKKRLPNCSE